MGVSECVVGPEEEFPGDGCLEFDGFSGGRVFEREFPCVEHEAVREGGGGGGFFAVDGVCDDGCALVVEVDADLVGAAGVEVAEDEGGAGGGVGVEDLVVGDGGFAAGWVDDGHFLAVDGVAADVGEDGVFGRGGDAAGDGEVEFFHGFALGELGDEGLVGGVGFGDDEAAGGVFVEAVDDAGAFDAADAGELALAVVEESVDEGAVGVSGAGVDDHAVGFVEDDDVFVFVEDVEGDVLGCVFEGDGFGDDDGDFVAGFDGVAWFGGVAVEGDELLADERLDAGAREFGELGGEKGVEAPGCLVVGENFHGLSFVGGGMAGQGGKTSGGRGRREEGD